MPGYSRGKERNVITFVNINDVFLYGWAAPDLAAATGISAADLKTQLGHLNATEADAVANRIMVLGCNAPKPARVTKRKSNPATSEAASTSTYCAFDKMAAATTGGWKNSKPKKGVLLRPAGSTRTCTAVAKLSNDVLYAFPLNTTDFNLAKTALGLEDSTTINSTEAKKLATGMSSTRPGQARKLDGQGFLTTFYSTAAAELAASDNWEIVSAERILYPKAAVTP